MQDIEVGINQDECVARAPESWAGLPEDQVVECMVDVIFNNDGAVKREFIARRITILTCGCIIVDDVAADAGTPEG